LPRSLTLARNDEKKVLLLAMTGYWIAASRYALLAMTEAMTGKKEGR